MRKAVKLLALTTLTAALCATLCATLTGCEAVKDATIGENPVKTVYVYLPDGTLLDKGRADKVSSFVHNDRIVKVPVDGKTYETSWANVVLVEE